MPVRAERNLHGRAASLIMQLLPATRRVRLHELHGRRGRGLVAALITQILRVHPAEGCAVRR